MVNPVIRLTIDLKIRNGGIMETSIEIWKTAIKTWNDNYLQEQLKIMETIQRDAPNKCVEVDKIVKEMKKELKGRGIQ